MKLFEEKINKEILAICFLLCFLLIFSFVNAVDTQEELAGWGWSDNIGWISFSCENQGSCDSVNYKVLVENNGDMLGHAWSENIGWISFNGSDLANCPSGACKAKIDGNNINGWGKALSANYNGWDGWISLKGSNPSYGVSYYPDTGEFDGYAWGGEVVGWINFDNVINRTILEDLTEPAIVVLDAYPRSDISGFETKLFWNNTNAVSCLLSGGSWSWSWELEGSEALFGEIVGVGPITEETIFSMTCLNSIGEETTENVIVTLSPPDFSLQKNTNIELEGVKGTTTPASVIVIPQNGFNSNVNLRVSSMSPELENAIFNLDDSQISLSEYGVGAEVTLFINDPLSSGNYDVVLQGEGGGLVRNINITLSVDNKNIEIEEF